MNLTELKAWKINDLLDRFHEAMYDNYLGGDTLVVENLETTQEGDDFGVPAIKHRWFSGNELELIERENVLETLRKEGWEIEEQRAELAEFVDVQWLFKAKEVKE